MKKTLISIAVGLGFFVPAVVAAQTSATGLLTVYVQVVNQSGFTYSPNNFTVAVSGQSPSPSSFQGSQQGTLVSLNPGTYSVAVTNQLGYAPAYSVGCNNTIAAGQTQTCVITLSGSNAFTQNPTPYPYPYNYTQPAFTCRSETPVVALGQTARFTAIGGVGGTYNWTTASQNFPNVGPVFTTTFQSSGTQTVTVTNAAQTAACLITVTTSYSPIATTPPAPSYPGSVYPGYQTPGYGYPQPSLTYAAYPRLPNTGFAPSSGAEMAFALVLIMGAGIAVFPHARKAFAVAVR